MMVFLKIAVSYEKFMIFQNATNGISIACLLRRNAVFETNCKRTETIRGGGAKGLVLDVNCGLLIFLIFWVMKMSKLLKLTSACDGDCTSPKWNECVHWS